MSASSPSSPYRKRRPPLSCTECRRRKVRCDRVVPCTRCVDSANARSCRYVQQEGQANTRNNNAKSYWTSTDESSHLRDLGQASVAPYVAHRANPVTIRDVESDDNSVQGEFRLDELIPLPSQPTITPPRANTHVSIMGTTNVDEHTELLRGRKISRMMELVRGENDRTKYWGRSHKSISFSQFDELRTFLCSFQNGRPPSISSLRQLSSTWAKSSQWKDRHSEDHAACPMRELLPEKSVADKLVELYMANFEATYRILHIPTFHMNYAAILADAQESSMLQLATVLSVLAVGAGLHPETVSNGCSASTSARSWILVVQEWLASCGDKARRSLAFLQIGCLSVLARRVNSIQGDMTWMTAGVLLRVGIAVGLHRDPSAFLRVTPFFAELRRRLWYTILELDLESSVVLGFPTSLSPETFDCRVPSDVEDGQLQETMKEIPKTLTSSPFTRTSFQVLQTRSLPLRMKISKAINKVHFDVEYEEVLKLDAELKLLSQETLHVVQSVELLSFAPSTFQQTCIEILVRRWTLLLHEQYAVRASDDPRFLYSHRASLESAIAILSLLDFSRSREEQLDSQVLGIGGGMFIDDFFKSALVIAREMLMQTKRPFPTGNRFLASMDQTYMSQLQGLLDKLGEALEATLWRWKSSANAYVWLSMVRGLVKAYQIGSDSQAEIERHLEAAIQFCTSLILKQQVPGQESNDESITEAEWDMNLNDISCTSSLMGFDFAFGDFVP